MNKKIVAIFTLMIGFVGIFYIAPAIIRSIRPNIIVDSMDHRTGFIDFDFTFWLDVSVHNEGGAGTATVTVALNQGTDFWKKTQTVHLNRFETKDLTFTFKELSFWSTEAGSYSVQIEY